MRLPLSAQAAELTSNCPTEKGCGLLTPTCGQHTIKLAVLQPFTRQNDPGPQGPGAMSIRRAGM